MSATVATVAEALALARTLGVGRLDAQLLVGHVLERERGWLIANDAAALTEGQALRVEDLLRRRADEVPYAYLVGEQEFHGLMLEVDAHTLVPRADTETLVDWALELLAPLPGEPAVVDLGTGSGAIALAIKHRHPAATVEAVDLSAGALAVAARNAERHGLAIEFHRGDWWGPLAGRRYDLIASNPPYIAGDDTHLPALRHEPITALTPGGDGLSALRAIIDGAPAHLRNGGWLLLEHGYDQAAAVARLLAARGFEALALRHDLGGQPRVSGGRWSRG